MAVNLNPEGADQDSGSGLVKSSENTPGRDKRIVAGDLGSKHLEIHLLDCEFSLAVHDST